MIFCLEHTIQGILGSCKLGLCKLGHSRMEHCAISVVKL